MQNSSDIVVIENRDGVARYVSPAVQLVLGYAAEDMVGNNLFNYLHSDDVPSAQTLFASLVEQPGASVNLEFRARHAAGQWIDLEATATNLLQHPRVEGVVVHARDVTDRTRAEAEATALLEVARDISGTLDLEEILERVQRRIAAVLPCDRVATFARDPSRDMFRVIGHYGVPPELHRDALTLEFPPTAEVATLLLSGQTLVITVVLEISSNVGADLQPIQTDPLKLRMVLSNLVDNAIKFTEHGGVTVDVRASDGGVEFAVRDTGIGIPPEARALIFEPFQQVGGRGRAGGVGLGLYIVRRLLDMMGGRVGVESAVGRGSIFRVWLPSVQADTLDQKVAR